MPIGHRHSNDLTDRMWELEQELSGLESHFLKELEEFNEWVNDSPMDLAEYKDYSRGVSIGISNLKILWEACEANIEEQLSIEEALEYNGIR